jgi:hypothetical protein
MCEGRRKGVLTPNQSTLDSDLQAQAAAQVPWRPFLAHSLPASCAGHWTAPFTHATQNGTPGDTLRVHPFPGVAWPGGPCAAAHLAITVRAQPKGVALGGLVRVAVKVRNVGAAAQQDVAIRLTLPEGVGQVLSATAAKTGAVGGGSKKPAPVPATLLAPNVYWLALSIPAGKGLKVHVKARLSACPGIARTALPFTALVYQTDATGNVICATPAERPGTTWVKPLEGPHRGKTVPPSSACASPTPAPGTQYVLVGENQRLLDAQPTPMPGQRRRLNEGTVDTADDCYQACSFAGYRMPFYMNFVAQPASGGGAAQCYCCQICGFVWWPGAMVF